jgi:MFS family permease
MTTSQDQYSTSGVTPTTIPAAESAQQTSKRPGPFSPFRRRNFRLLYLGQLISSLGDQAYALALPWTVLVATGDPRQMAIVLAAEAAPRVLFLLLGGALADRLGPRLIMLVADLGRAGVVAALGVTLFVGLPPLWVVAILAGLQGVGSGLFQPGSQALIPQTASDEELPAANGFMQTIQYLSLTIGPALGGIATAAQASIAFLADAASFAVSALTLFAMRLPRRTAGQRADLESTADDAAKRDTGLLGAVGAGVKYAFGHPLIRVGMAVTVLANFALSGALTVAIVVLINQMTHNALALGLVFGAAGVGGVLGGLSAGLLGRLPRRGVVALSLWIVMATLLTLIPFVAGLVNQWPLDVDVLSLLPLGTADVTTRVLVIAALLGLIGFVLAIGDTMFLTIFQQRSAPEYLARVFSVQFVAGGITQPLSLVAAGIITAAYGVETAFLASGAILLIAIVVGLSSRELRRV